MRGRRKEELHCKAREKGGLEDGKAGGEEDERIFAKGKEKTRRRDERILSEEKG
jgi:hypothetical protein